MSPQKIGVYFSMEKSVEWGSFVFLRTIIRPPFMFEWRDREYNSGVYFLGTLWFPIGSGPVYAPTCGFWVLGADMLSKPDGHWNADTLPPGALC